MRLNGESRFYLTRNGTIWYILVMKKKPKRSAKKVQSSEKIADPETLLAAAEKAPSVFSIAGYFRPIYVMRRKGYSWRHLREWLHGFNIEISPVHLRRLYVQENERLSRLSAEELSAMGMPQEMIDGCLKESDPTKRLIAADPEDAVEAERREALLRSGLSGADIEKIDLSQPVKIGDQEI